VFETSPATYSRVILREKMAFFTSVKAHVPLLAGESEDEDGGGDATLRLLSSSGSTPRAEEGKEGEEGLTEGLSTETVNTLTGEEERGGSQASTPTPGAQAARFTYDVDPELGAFV
jgi:hypothetical protein